MSKLTYTDEHLKKAYDYLERWEELEDAMPQVASLALHCGVSRRTIYNWIKRPECEEFAEVYEFVLTTQEQTLINGGLRRDFDASLTKIFLIKHGYTDKQEIDLSSPDGSMTPKALDSAEKKALIDQIRAGLSGGD